MKRPPEILLGFCIYLGVPSLSKYCASPITVSRLSGWRKPVHTSWSISCTKNHRPLTYIRPEVKDQCKSCHCTNCDTYCDYILHCLQCLILTALSSPASRHFSGRMVTECGIRLIGSQRLVMGLSPDHGNMYNVLKACPHITLAVERVVKLTLDPSRICRVLKPKNCQDWTNIIG